MADGISTRIDELHAALADAEEIKRRFPDAMLRAEGICSESITLGQCDIVREVVAGERVYLRAGVKVGRSTVWMEGGWYQPMLWSVLDRLMRDPAGRVALLKAMEAA